MELTTEYRFVDFTAVEVLAVSKFATENSDSDGSSSSSDSSEEVDDFGSSASEEEEESQQGEYDQDAQARSSSVLYQFVSMNEIESSFWVDIWQALHKPLQNQGGIVCLILCVHRTRKMKSEEKKNGLDEWSWVWETDLLREQKRDNYINKKWFQKDWRSLRTPTHHKATIYKLYWHSTVECWAFLLLFIFWVDETQAIPRPKAKSLGLPGFHPSNSSKHHSFGGATKSVARVAWCCMPFQAAYDSCRYCRAITIELIPEIRWFHEGLSKWHKLILDWRCIVIRQGTGSC